MVWRNGIISSVGGRGGGEGTSVFSRARRAGQPLPADRRPRRPVARGTGAATPRRGKAGKRARTGKTHASSSVAPLYRLHARVRRRLRSQSRVVCAPESAVCRSAAFYARRRVRPPRAPSTNSPIPYGLLNFSLFREFATPVYALSEGDTRIGTYTPLRFGTYPFMSRYIIPIIMDYIIGK